MNDNNRSNRTRISALAVSVALTMAAAIGLTAASESQAPRRADAQSQRSGAATDGGSASPAAECAKRRSGADAA